MHNKNKGVDKLLNKFEEMNKEFVGEYKIDLDELLSEEFMYKYDIDSCFKEHILKCYKEKEKELKRFLEDTEINGYIKENTLFDSGFDLYNSGVNVHLSKEFGF